MQEAWNKYYAEYIQNNKDKGFDLFTLTNNAIAYCMDKLGLSNPTSLNSGGKSE